MEMDVPDLGTNLMAPSLVRPTDDGSVEEIVKIVFASFSLVTGLDVRLECRWRLLLSEREPPI